MTKRELLDLLAPFADEQTVYVCLHSKDVPQGCQVALQGVRETEPWNKGEVPNLIGLLAHADNTPLAPATDTEEKQEPVWWKK